MYVCMSARAELRSGNKKQLIKKKEIERKVLINDVANLFGLFGLFVRLLPLAENSA